MIDNQPILSFLVVTHNHHKCIRRCLDSLLSIKCRYPYEIVVGDDASTDDTYYIIKEYECQHPETIKTYQIHSDDCNPISNGERAGYNRRCGYKLLKGKYYAEVDGDDFVLSNNAYEHQVELLEAHPDCSLAMQNIFMVCENEKLENKKKYLATQLQDEQITTSAEYLSTPDNFMQHQGFVFRRSRRQDPSEVLGRFYEDMTISLFHMQEGNIVFSNISGYVYIIYKTGINFELQYDDRLLMLGLMPLMHIRLFPNLTKYIMQGALKEWNHLLRETIKRNLKLQQNSYNYINLFEGYIYKYYTRGTYTILEKIRLVIARFMILFILKYRIQKDVYYKYLLKMLV